MSAKSYVKALIATIEICIFLGFKWEFKNVILFYFCIHKASICPFLYWTNWICFFIDEYTVHVLTSFALFVTKKRKYKINGQYSALLLFEALNLSKIAFFKPIYSKTFVFTFEFQGLQNYLRLPSNYLNFIKITPKCIKCATWFRLLNNLNSNLVTCSNRKQQIVRFCYLWLFSLSTWYMHGEFIYLM